MRYVHVYMDWPGGIKAIINGKKHFKTTFSVLFSISNISFLSTFLKEFKEFVIKGKNPEMQLKEICLIMHIQVLNVTNNCLVLGIFYFLNPFSLNFAICTKSVVIFICHKPNSKRFIQILINVNVLRQSVKRNS